ncbi:MAG: HAD-IA family hydrolase [Microthrixaceae bacterium]|nr:HAD family hydrolase [Microthrixaceae bacterium]MCO5319489.1 HAD-IA family hydrolase [Microthrixaceae bacterium]
MPISRPSPRVVVFDFDGTLVDSDEALLEPFDMLGIDRSRVVMGSAVAEECESLGVSMDAYVDAYDTDSVKPFAGVEEMLSGIPRWTILSNKHPRPAMAELARLGWAPEVVMCADAFDWAHKSLVPMLERMGLDASDVAMVGDSGGDLRCAQEVGCRFLWAGWNPRVRDADPEGEVLDEPAQLLSALGLP